MMDWLIILITSFIISAILFFIVFLRNNNDPGSILIKNVVKLNALLNYNIFVKEENILVRRRIC